MVRLFSIGLLVLPPMASASTCVIQAPQTIVVADDLRPGSKISVSTWGGWGADPVRLANQFRLRDSEGAVVPWTADRLRARVRFTPEEPLTPGQYALEVLGEYDADGYRVQVGDRGAVSHSAWFRSRVVDVVDTPTARPKAPDNAQWSRFHNDGRSSAGPMAAIEVRAEVDPTAAWVELEVKGVGPIATGSATPEGKTYIRASSELCVRGTQSVPLPHGGDLKVRLVAVGGEGERVAGAWTVLGPSVLARSYPLPEASAPSGRRAKLESIPTVLPVELQPDPRQVVDFPSTCGTLQPVGAGQEEGFAPGMKLHVDDAGQVRVTRVLPGKIRIDDREVPLEASFGLRSPSLSLVGEGESVVLAFVDSGGAGIHVLQLNGSTLVRRALVPAESPDGIQVKRFETDGEELLLRWDSHTGSRFRQRFDAALEPVGPLEEITEPVVVDHRTPDILVNGHAVQGLEGAHRQEHVLHEGVVYLTTRTRDVGHLVAANLFGEVQWHERFPGRGVKSLVVDSFGVHVVLNSIEPGFEPRSFSHYGEVMDPMEPPVPERVPSKPLRAVEERRAVGDRTMVVVRGRRQAFGYADGSSPPVLSPLPTDAVVGTSPDGAEVAWIETGSIRRQRYECSGKRLGVPHFWLP